MENLDSLNLILIHENPVKALVTPLPFLFLVLSSHVYVNNVLLSIQALISGLIA